MGFLLDSQELPGTMAEVGRSVDCRMAGATARPKPGFAFLCHKRPIMHNKRPTLDRGRCVAAVKYACFTTPKPSSDRQ
jgi:hypothetical protein